MSEPENPTVDSEDVVVSDTVKNTRAGIKAKTIEADNVVHGMQIQGEVATVASQVDLAKALSSGFIEADSVRARSVVAGLQYISDPAQTTLTQLRQEVTALQAQLQTVIDANEITNQDEAEDARNALQKAADELIKPEPSGHRVIRKLGEATEILIHSAEAAEAAGKAGQIVIKLAPIVAALWKIATKLFGV